MQSSLGKFPWCARQRAFFHILSDVAGFIVVATVGAAAEIGAAIFATMRDRPGLAVRIRALPASKHQGKRIG